MQGLKEIVVERLAQLNVGAVEAATSAGIERTYIRDIIDDRKKSVRQDKIPGLARALKLDPDALARGRLVPAADEETTIEAAKLQEVFDRLRSYPVALKDRIISFAEFEMNTYDKSRVKDTNPAA